MSQTELLAAHFEEAFSAPDGLKRLRELILTLAMQGKLVKQDPSEGTADDLLRDIETEKRRLVAEGQLKQPKSLSAIDPGEMPYEVPQGWRWVRLKSVSHDWGQKVPDKALTYIDVGSIDSRLGKISANVQSVAPYDASSRARKIVKFGTVIYSTIRPYLLNIAIIEENYLPEPIASTAFAVLHPYKFIEGKFLYHFLRSPVINSSIERKMKGVAYPAIGEGEFFQELFPLPPLAEQRRIVAQIDQLMNLCDELEALRAQREQKRVQVHTTILREIMKDTDPTAFQQNWQFLADHFGELHATPQNVAELRSAVLQLAVMGKLVPQDPAEGTARELLAEIEEEKRRLAAAGEVKAPKPLPPVKEAKQPHLVPEEWAWVRLGAVSTTRLGKMLDQSKNRGVPKPYLRNTNVQWERFELDDIKEMKFDPGEFEEFALEPGDLLICEGGEPGRCAIWRGIEGEMYFQKALHRVRPFSGVVPEWILFNLKKDAQSKMLNEYFTGATIKHFPGEKLVMYSFPLPPLSEQRRIVAKVYQLMGLCDALESRLRERTTKQGELLRAVLAELAPTLLSTRPTVMSHARTQTPVGAEAPRGRGRPRKMATEDTAAAVSLADERRGRGRPRKDGSSPARSIPEASSMGDAIQRLEALKLERAAGARQVGLFED